MGMKAKRKAVRKMTLDEAIKHCEEKAEELRKQSDGFVLCTNVKKECLKCAEEHEQLAEWLKELKAYKDAEALQAKISKY